MPVDVVEDLVAVLAREAQLLDLVVVERDFVLHFARGEASGPAAAGDAFVAFAEAGAYAGAKVSER